MARMTRISALICSVMLYALIGCEAGFVSKAADWLIPSATQDDYNFIMLTSWLRYGMLI